MAYVVYMGKTLLPITPSKISMKIRNQNKTINLLDESEINVPRKQGLIEISFECRLPQVKGVPFAMYKNKNEFHEAYYYLEKFETLKGMRKPFQFIVFRESQKILLKETLQGKKSYQYDFENKKTSMFHNDIKVTLEEYEIKDDASNGTDIMVSIKLKQFVPYGTKIPESKGKPGKGKTDRDTSGKDGKKNHLVKKGDTLSGIARKECGSISFTGKIYELNKATIEAAAKKNGRQSSSNGHYIYPGTNLRLP